MANKSRVIADHISDDELADFANWVKLDVDLVKGLDDKGLCELLNCEMSELPYLLFTDAQRADEVADVGMAFGSLDDWASLILEREQDELASEWDDDWDYEGDLIDLDYIMENPTPRPIPAMYALPPASAYKPKPLPKWVGKHKKQTAVVKHHFEIIQ